MRDSHLLRLAILLVILLSLLMQGCATVPAPSVIVVPCPAARDLPTPPARTIETNPKEPGATVRAAVINRAQWMAHADELAARLESCKQ